MQRRRTTKEYIAMLILCFALPLALSRMHLAQAAYVVSPVQLQGTQVSHSSFYLARVPSRHLQVSLVQHVL